MNLSIYSLSIHLFLHPSVRKGSETGVLKYNCNKSGKKSMVKKAPKQMYPQILNTCGNKMMVRKGSETGVLIYM